MIDLSPLAQAAIEILAAVLLAVGTWAVAQVSARLAKSLKLKSDDMVRAYLEQAVLRGIDFAAARMSEAAAQHAKLKVGDPRVADAAAYVTTHVPDALKHLKITPDAVADMVRARLPPPPAAGA